MTYIGRGSTEQTIREWNGENYAPIQTPRGVPYGGTFDEVATRVDDAVEAQFIRKVATSDGTDLIVPGDSGVLGIGNQDHRGYAYSSDGGETWNIVADPLGGSYSVGFVLTDSLTGRFFAIGADPSTIGSPDTYGRRELTSIYPFAAASSTVTIQDGSGNDCTVLGDAISPGNGRHYYSAQFVSAGPLIVEYDIVSDSVLNTTTTTGSAPQSLAFDDDTAKYGDGFARLYYGSIGNGVGRITLDGFTEEVATLFPSGPAPGGGAPWGGPASGIDIDGPTNVGFIICRNFNNGRISLVKYSLEPLGTTAYSAELGTTTNYQAVSVKYDAGSGIVVAEWVDLNVTYSGGWNESHVSVYQDTGAALNLINDFVVPEVYGSASWGGSTIGYMYDPAVSFINGKFYIPLNGGREASGGPFDLLDIVLEVDTADTSTLGVATITENIEWRALTEGDLIWEGTDLNIESIFGYTWGPDNAFFSGAIPTGNQFGTYWRVYGTEIIPVYVPWREVVSGFTTSTSVGTNFDGLVMKKHNSNHLDINLNARTGIPSDHGAYDIDIIDITALGLGDGGGVADITPNGGRLIYGLEGGASSVVTSMQMHTPREHLKFTYNPEDDAWQVSERYRPWYALGVNAGSSVAISFGKVIHFVRTASGSGTTNFTLPGGGDYIPEAGDEVLIVDIDNNAFVNNIAITGAAGYGINEVAAGTPVVLNTNGAFIHLRFSSDESKWVIMARSPSMAGAQTSEAGGIAPPLGGAISSLADSANVDVDLSPPRNGYYTYTVNVLVRMDTAGTYVERQFVGSARRVAGTLTLQDTAVEVTGGWITTGLTVTVSANAGDFRVNVSNGTGETVDGRVHLNYMVQDLIP